DDIRTDDHVGAILAAFRRIRPGRDALGRRRRLGFFTVRPLRRRLGRRRLVAVRLVWTLAAARPVRCPITSRGFAPGLPARRLRRPRSLAARRTARWLVAPAAMLAARARRLRLPRAPARAAGVSR